MASDDLMKQLQSLADNIFSIDTNKLLRSSLGKVSLEKDFGTTLEKIWKRIDLVRQYGREVHDDQIQDILRVLDNIRVVMEQQAESSDQDYISNSPTFLRNIRDQLEALRRYWPSVVLPRSKPADFSMMKVFARNTNAQSNL